MFVDVMARKKLLQVVIENPPVLQELII